MSTAGLEQELAGVARGRRGARAAARATACCWCRSLVLAIGVVLAALQGVRLARPIKALTVQAERIAAGDLNSRVPEDRRDELGVLARTFNLMADEIQRAARRAGAEGVAREGDGARAPGPAGDAAADTLDQHGSLKVVGYCMPASSCGGDWWTYRKLSNGRMLLVVGDATGHGIHSAMIAATARGAVEALSAIDERLLTPEQVLRAIDSAIRQVGDHNVLMTAFAAVFDSIERHPALRERRAELPVRDEARRDARCSRTRASSPRAATRSAIATSRSRSGAARCSSGPGDLFVCFTDGVVERANPAGKLFGDRRLRGALTGQPLPDGDALVQLRDRVVADARAVRRGHDRRGRHHVRAVPVRSAGDRTLGALVGRAARGAA